MIPKEKWVEAVRDFQERPLPALVERDYRLPMQTSLNRALVLVGPRRAGKTYLLFQLMGELLKTEKKTSMFYINLERADLPAVGVPDLLALLEVCAELHGGVRWLFLDEIQNVPGWESFVRTALDRGIKVVLTGSSSRMLSTDIATSMRGRALSYTILPFSFREYLRARGIGVGPLSSAQRARLLQGWREYVQWGGYPEVVIAPAVREKVLAEIRETVIFRDMVERHKVRNTKALKLLLDALVQSPRFSVHAFYRFVRSLGVRTSKTSLYRYLEWVNDAFFVFLVRKYSPSYRESEQSLPKTYFVDNGLLTIQGKDDQGRLLENAVFIELLRRGEQMRYHTFQNNREVDFVLVEKKAVRQLIQVCYDIGNFTTKEREIRSLVQAAAALRCSNLLVLTGNYEAEEKVKGKAIRFVPVWKWLLEETDK